MKLLACSNTNAKGDTVQPINLSEQKIHELQVSERYVPFIERALNIIAAGDGYGVDLRIAVKQATKGLLGSSVSRTVLRYAYNTVLRLDLFAFNSSPLAEKKQIICYYYPTLVTTNERFGAWWIYDYAATTARIAKALVPAVTRNPTEQAGFGEAIYDIAEGSGYAETEMHTMAHPRTQKELLQVSLFLFNLYMANTHAPSPWNPLVHGIEKSLVALREIVLFGTKQGTQEREQAKAVWADLYMESLVEHKKER